LGEIQEATARGLTAGGVARGRETLWTINLSAGE
jgi:hypothetical protein